VDVLINWQNQAEPALPHGGSASGRTYSAGTSNILVVDDEPLIQRLIVRVLSIEGHSVDSTGDGATAWSMLQNKNYDCIIMDWKMPGLTGRELYQLIENCDLKLANRCVFISGHAANPELDEFISPSQNPVLVKPFSIAQIRAVVGTLLKAGAARR
jgi:CheY-like chemotaxis protein